MTIDMKTVKDVTLNGQTVKYIHDLNNNQLWPYNSGPIPPYGEQFYIKNETNEDITFTCWVLSPYTSRHGGYVYISYDNITWIYKGQLTHDGTRTEISFNIQANSLVYIKNYGNTLKVNYSATGSYSIWGDINTFWNEHYTGISYGATIGGGTNIGFDNHLKYVDNYLFRSYINSDFDYAFKNCSNLRNVPKIFFTSDYQGSINLRSMFEGCTSLTSLPVDYLYQFNNLDFNFSNMFEGCIGLTSIPILPNILPDSCCQEMFKGCTGLTSLPDNLLPATTLSKTCYYGMFSGCTGLTSLPANLLPATTLASGCYNNMFEYCTGLTSLPANLLPATTLASSCYAYMFKGCTGLTSLPDNLLPATTLANSCYYGMFEECNNLNNVPANLLPATTLASSCYYRMFYNCYYLTIAPDLPALDLVTKCYRYMFCYCSRLYYIKAMFITDITSTTDYTAYWCESVSRGGIFVKNINATWNRSGNSGIPNYWTVQTVNP